MVEKAQVGRVPDEFSNSRQCLIDRGLFTVGVAQKIFIRREGRPGQDLAGDLEPLEKPDDLPLICFARVDGIELSTDRINDGDQARIEL